jgi:hypothetical protein
MRRFVLLMVGLWPIVIVTIALAQAAAAPQPEDPIAKGVIYGTVVDQDGQPAKELGLTPGHKCSRMSRSVVLESRFDKQIDIGDPRDRIRKSTLLPGRVGKEQPVGTRPRSRFVGPMTAQSFAPELAYVRFEGAQNAVFQALRPK